MTHPSATPDHDRARSLASAWRVLRYSSVTALALELTDAMILIFGAGAGERGPVALFAFGWVLFVGVVVYGVWHRMRWALWVGGVYAVLAILTFPFSNQASLQLGATTFRSTGISSMISWLLVAAYAVFLYGLARLRRARRG